MRWPLSLTARDNPMSSFLWLFMRRDTQNSREHSKLDHSYLLFRCLKAFPVWPIVVDIDNEIIFKWFKWNLWQSNFANEIRSSIIFTDKFKLNFWYFSYFVISKCFRLRLNFASQLKACPASSKRSHSNERALSLEAFVNCFSQRDESFSDCAANINFISFSISSPSPACAVHNFEWQKWFKNIVVSRCRLKWHFRLFPFVFHFTASHGAITKNVRQPAKLFFTFAVSNIPRIAIFHFFLSPEFRSRFMCRWKHLENRVHNKLSMNSNFMIIDKVRSL